MGTSLYRSTLLNRGGFSVSDYIQKFTKSKPDVKSIKLRDGFCHQSTQTSQEVKEAISGETELQKPEVCLHTDLIQPSSSSAHLNLPEASESPTSTVESYTAISKCRGSLQVQTFAPEVQLEMEDTDLRLTKSSVATTDDLESYTESTNKVETELPLQIERAVEESDATEVGEPLLKAVVHGQQEEMKVEVGEKHAEVSSLVNEASLKSPEKQKKGDVANKLHKKVHAPHKPELGTKEQAKDAETTEKKTEDAVKLETKVDEIQAIKSVKKTENTNYENVLQPETEKKSVALNPQITMHTDGGKGKAAFLRKAESTLLIIDDSPPLPAPFEHRIVSAKQVPLNSYYAVNPKELLGGGRFGQVHKCAELSSGLTLAAKIIKVRGMKERVKSEVKLSPSEVPSHNRSSPSQGRVKSDTSPKSMQGKSKSSFKSRQGKSESSPKSMKGKSKLRLKSSVEGGELFERIVDEKYQLTELDAIVFTRQICEGVQYLHQQYILHLDLKDRKYRPREKLKVNFGTPEFLAPEVVNYDFVSFPTDMWSVGVITYMLLSGLSPFMGDNDAETMNNILHAKWDFDAEAFENVSEEAKDFISNLLLPAKCSRMSASGCMKHSWLNNLEDKAKRSKVRLKSQMLLQRYLAAHRQWKKHFYAVAAANRLKRFQQSRSISTPL
ncbi:hypothetical protein DNTS_012987 [Danionella cerebrum]|uniref:Protein kinase domain-containing protein n=1 Tax=Danionella cerebrum TaxID=2873325 RepID=A0A553MU79_9TELE|nr:hypothetical protein DNTS_012987 [Danionella translucida]